MANIREFVQRVDRAEVPEWLQMVVSPLVSKEWAVELAGHPDREFRDYILIGISHGFHIGFDYGRYTCRPASSNMGSSSKNVEAVQAYLDKEVAPGRIVGPINPSSAPCGTQVSPVGVIPKSNHAARKVEADSGPFKPRGTKCQWRNRARTLLIALPEAGIIYNYTCCKTKGINDNVTAQTNHSVRICHTYNF